MEKKRRRERGIREDNTIYGPQGIYPMWDVEMLHFIPSTQVKDLKVEDYKVNDGTGII